MVDVRRGGRLRSGETEFVYDAEFCVVKGVYLVDGEVWVENGRIMYKAGWDGKLRIEVR